ncbi:hypothetical protein RXV88_13715 [Aestuariicoccus sp. MJ-SS9]|nr:hypothetical protein [Aestuariicoccus sp. MJ-SS9]
MLFIRAGSLDDPAAMPPDVHVHTAAKQPHVYLSRRIAQFAAFYDPAKVWPVVSRSRYAVVIASHNP